MVHPPYKPYALFYKQKILKRVETMRKALECQIEILNEQVGQLKSKLGDAQSG